MKSMVRRLMSSAMFVAGLAAPLASGCDEVDGSLEDEEVEAVEKDDDRPIAAEDAEAADESRFTEDAAALDEFKDADNPAFAMGWCCDKDSCDGPAAPPAIWTATGCTGPKGDESFCSANQCFASCFGSYTSQGGRVTCYG